MWLALLLGVISAEGGEICALDALQHQMDVLDESTTVQDLAMVALTAQILVQECPGLHRGVLDGLQSLQEGTLASHLQLADYGSAADAPHVWNDACVGGLTVLSDMAALPEEDKRPMLWDACALGHRGWFTKTEWVASRGSVVVALQVGSMMEKAGASRRVTSRYVRNLAGVL